MNRIVKHFLVMLLWQVIAYCLLFLAPLLALFIWPKGGGVDLLIALTWAWWIGSLWLLGRSFNRMLHSDDGEGCAAVPTTRWASFKLPRKFGRMAPWTLLAEGVSFIVGIGFSGHRGHAAMLTATTILWALAMGVLWWLWTTRELRFLPDPLPPAVELNLIDTDHAPEGGEPGKRIETEEDSVVSQVVRDILQAEVLPPLVSGEQQWVLGLDGKPIAIITQSPIDPEQWPEPEWLVDPDSPFKADTTHVIFVPRATQTRRLRTAS